MNDEQMQPLLEAWFRDTDPSPPDTRRTAVQVMARVPQTRQQRRWWAFPLFRRKAQTPTANEMTKYQPSLIPATNGHAPTVIGRTQTMFSPVKAITAGALVFAIGGVMLIAQPFGQQGSVPGAEQPADHAPPVEVTGTYRGLDCDADGDFFEDDSNFEVDGPVERYEGSTCTVFLEWSDPRLQGTDTYVDNGLDYGDDDSELSIGHYVHNIVTDDGVWRMRPQFRFDSADGLGGEGPGNFGGTYVLDGEGAYEGLIAVLAKEGEDLHGFIVDVDLPPPPEEGSTK